MEIDTHRKKILNITQKHRPPPLPSPISPPTSLALKQGSRANGGWGVSSVCVGGVEMRIQRPVFSFQCEGPTRTAETCLISPVQLYCGAGSFQNSNETPGERRLPKRAVPNGVPEVDSISLLLTNGL